MGSQPQKAAAMARVRPIQPKASWTYANPARANFLCAKRLEYVSAYSDLAHNVCQSSAWLSSSLISKPGDHQSTAVAHWTALARKPLTNHSVAQAADILMSAMQIHHTPDAMVVDSLMRFTLHAVLCRWPPPLNRQVINHAYIPCCFGSDPNCVAQIPIAGCKTRQYDAAILD
jgi:hypothetical protein